MSFEQSIFRAYDVRGTYPDQMNEEVAYAAGRAFVSVMNAKTVAVGRDVRASGVAIQEAVIRGVTDAGADAVDIGVISTEMLYFAAGTLEVDGGMSITASHNPAQWNGIKFIGKGAVPLTKEEKLGGIYAAINAPLGEPAFSKGSVEKRDLSQEYVAYLQRFVPRLERPLKLAVNVNFGANGKYLDALAADLPLEIVRLNWNEDGTFPKGTPDPLLPKNYAEIAATIPAQGCDFGAAFDADADRCFFYDEQGRFFHGYYVTAMLIDAFLADNPGDHVIVERRLTWANVAAAANGGGELVFSRTGHGYIKQAMRANRAVFGGESSGHYYFRDYFGCDSGLVTFLTVIGIFSSELAAGRTVSGLLDRYLREFPCLLEERNYVTERAAEIIQAASDKYPDAAQTHDDGLTVEFPDWRFSLRSSSNEPIMRLNAEARTQEGLAEREKELTGFVASFGAVLRDDHA